ncbi:MAG TPA: radical SAM protein [Polyangiaceae bacterium]|nr:radical SAM protein [Polyangiaceae bacterium]
METLPQRITRTLREVRMVTWGLLDTTHPILAQIVPMRRCNLACGYCNEYDKVSDPVPIAEMLRRIDKLGELRTGIVTISGGEPMMHPELDDIIRRVRDRGMLAGLITNGFYLSPKRIVRLNDAGLEYLQISIDNVIPDEVSQKSLKTLDKKLQHLAEHSRFHVNINSVVGAGMKNPEDALTIARRASELGFSTSVGILHDKNGQLEPLNERETAIYEECVKLGQGLYTRINDFQRNLIEGRPNAWQCRAGSRYLYVCEDGLVHYCSQQRGFPAIPIEQYTAEDIRREYKTPKACAPYCTIGCVHRASEIDNKYRQPLIQLRPFARASLL